MKRHIQFKHKDVWEKWRDYHLEWDSEVPFLRWLDTTFRKKEEREEKQKESMLKEISVKLVFIEWRLKKRIGN